MVPFGPLSLQDGGEAVKVDQVQYAQTRTILVILGTILIFKRADVR